MRPPTPRQRATILLVIGLTISAIAGARFVRHWTPEPLFPSPHVTQVFKLSKWHPPLAGTAAETDVYLFDSGVPGGTLLICGGTHPNEPAAYMAAVTILENLRVTEGRVFLIPRSNKAGFSHNDSQEAMPQRYRIHTAHGPRVFRHGSRLTNPVRQWPDPNIYINPHGTYWDEFISTCPDCSINNPGPGGQVLAGVDSRNLNRAFPGDPDGTITEQVAHAIMTLIREEGVDLAIDFHEASPEYPTINVMVAHQKAEAITSWAELLLSDDGIRIATDASSLRLRGMSHREWGDASKAMSVLFETANPVQGRLKGKTTEEQITLGRDGGYTRVQMIQQRLNERLAERARIAEEQGRPVKERSRKILYVEIPPEGVPIEERVGRHVTATRRLVEAYNDDHPENPIGLDGLPEYNELLANGLGPWLHGPDGQAPAGRP
ncbi:MAG: succinylglutamate desuccinylase/aspartoacylase family protein [Candidatus Sumerlaeia bacterium]|nr:succinylglutamate desuccinylase/aspartoacylase family protein [Candidatus Sumerlaeia bacterium]